MILQAVVGGFVLDALFADPAWLPHPVVLMGRCISRLEKFLRARLPGTPQGELLVILAHGGTQMAAMERYALPRRDYYAWCGPNAGGYVLDAKDWTEKRVLYLVKTVQYTKEAQ